MLSKEFDLVSAVVTAPTGKVQRTPLREWTFMKDEELQRFCDQNVRLKIGGRILEGRLICGGEAQITLNRPYAIKTLTRNPSMDTFDTHFDGIPAAEAVESVELVDEPVAEEIEDEVQDLQTPG